MSQCEDPGLEVVMQDVAKRHIKYSEDYRDKMYLDSEKYPTFGWGHCFDASRKYEDLRGYADVLFQRDFQRAYDDYRRIINRFALNHLSCARRMVILDMCYNMNYEKVAKFVNTLERLRTCRWEEAAEHMRDSLWYQQTGVRAKRLVNVMLTDRYPIVPSYTASGVPI